MQTILVPVDFTAASENALVYASSLASRLPAEIVLVGAGTGEAPGPAPQTAQLRKLEALAERLRYQQQTRQTGRRLAYSCQLAAEALPQAMPGLVASLGADLVVTGLMLEGGTATTAAGEAAQLLPEAMGCPVLLVPPGHPELATCVVVAGDFAHCDARQLAWLPTLARTPQAHFDLVQFRSESGCGLAALRKTLLSAHAYLPTAAVNLLPLDDTLEGISAFCAQQSAELLVMANSDAAMLSRFFNPLSSHSNPYHLCIPVLLLAKTSKSTEAWCAHCSQRQVEEKELVDVSMETI